MIKSYETAIKLKAMHVPTGKYTSTQNLAISMVSRINEALRVLQALGVNNSDLQICYHHYDNSIEKSLDK